MRVPPYLKQIFASSGPIFLQFSHAYILGINAIMIPSLRKDDSVIHLTLEQESWLPSILVLMLFPSTFISGFLTVRFGRKLIFCLSVLPNFPTAIIAFGAQNFNTLFTAYCIGGLIGGAVSIGPWIIAETCSPNLRGTLLNFRELALYLGFATSHFLGFFLDWRTLILWAIVPSMIAFLVTLTCPESPAWLASQSRFGECKTAFFWYRGNGDTEELEQLISCQKKILAKEKKRTKSKAMEMLGFLCDKSFWKATLISFACIVVFSMCGKQVFAIFAIDAVRAITNDSENAYYYATSLDFLDFISLTISCVMVLKFKRRSLLFKSGGGGVLLVLIFCLVQYLYSNSLVSYKIHWLPFALISGYFFVLGIGVMPVVFTLLGEVYPLAHRGVGTAMTSLIFVFFVFISTKISPWLMKNCGMHGLFLLNAVLISGALVILYYTVPETYNMTLQDIENGIRGEVADSKTYSLVDTDDKTEITKELNLA